MYFNNSLMADHINPRSELSQRPHGNGEDAAWYKEYMSASSVDQSTYGLGPSIDQYMGMEAYSEFEVEFEPVLEQDYLPPEEYIHTLSGTFKLPFMNELHYEESPLIDSIDHLVGF